MITASMSPTVDRLRYDIDSGRTHDKVAWPDPAAAPLGTDEECAGMPLHAAQVAQAHAAESGRLPFGEHRAPPTGSWILVAFIIAFAAAMIMAGALT